MRWIDTHCHLDAAEFAPDRDDVALRARDAGIAMQVLPAVRVADFEAVRDLAHRFGLSYALGIHPLYVDAAGADDLDRLAQALTRWRDDPRLVAVGEIGLDGFVPGLDRERQQRFYRAQLVLARAAGLPVILHLRRSADDLLAGLRRVPVAGGIAHAFNGSEAQALELVARGFALGFGGAMTSDRALRIRRLAAGLPASAIVLETDAPDIPPQWLRLPGAAPGRNEPAQLPRIAATLAGLRGWTLAHTAEATTANACSALPKLAALLRARRGCAENPSPTRSNGDSPFEDPAQTPNDDESPGPPSR